MNHIGLFEGIGGFSLAARWAGWETIAWCEWNEFGQRVLKHHFPKAIGHGNICETDFTIYRGQCDIVTGGFPCQPYSTAGKRLGKEDERHLWPEMLRAIREIQPRWVVGENVLGLVNWNGGMVFHEVQADLEAEGYEVQPYVLPACAVNAPHRRDRVWFVAYSHSLKYTSRGAGAAAKANGSGDDGKQKERCEQTEWSNGLLGLQQYAPDTDSANNKAQPQKRILGEEDEGRKTERFEYGNTRTMWDEFPTTEPTIRTGNDGISDRLDGITLPKWRNESIKAAGNAIVPQVAFQIFQAINQYETK